MKRFFIAMAAVAAMVGCSKESNDTTNVESKAMFVMNASIVTDDTRVTVDGKKFTEVNWEQGDVVALGSAKGTSANLVAETSGNTDVRFVGEGSAVADADTYYAIYPATTITEGVAQVALDSQAGDDAAVLVAKAEGVKGVAVDMAFKPANALLHVAVSGVSSLSKAEFKAFDGAMLPQGFAYDFESEAAENYGEVAAYTIENPANSFFFSLPADLDMSNGYVVSLTDANGNVCTKAYNGKTFARGTTTRVEIAWSTPVVTLVAPKTSYSYYVADDIATANSCANNVIYFNSASTYANVQNAMVAEAGFIVDGKEYVANIDTATKSFSMGNVTVSSWGAKSVKAYIKTKDGKRYKSAAETVYITGLPYHADWRSANYGDWKYTNISDKGAMLQVSNGKTGCIISPEFIVPGSDVKTSAAIAASTNATSVGGYTTSYAYVGTRSSSAKKSGATASLNYVSDFGGNVSDAPLNTYNSTLTLTSSNPCVVMVVSDFAIACNSYIYQAKIEYAE
jgi:hypothetical protein